LFYFRGRCTGGKYSLSMFFPLAMLYGIYFTFLLRQHLGYELEEKPYNIFPPGPVFFLLVTKKLSALLSLAIVGFIQVNTLLTTLLCFLEKPTI
jgi:hypothetical protein